MCAPRTKATTKGDRRRSPLFYVRHPLLFATRGPYYGYRLNVVCVFRSTQQQSSFAAAAAAAAAAVPRCRREEGEDRGRHRHRQNHRTGDVEPQQPNGGGRTTTTGSSAANPERSARSRTIGSDESHVVYAAAAAEEDDVRRRSDTTRIRCRLPLPCATATAVSRGAHDDDDDFRARRYGMYAADARYGLRYGLSSGLTQQDAKTSPAAAAFFLRSVTASFRLFLKRPSLFKSCPSRLRARRSPYRHVPVLVLFFERAYQTITAHVRQCIWFFRPMFFLDDESRAVFFSINRKNDCFSSVIFDPTRRLSRALSS